MKNGKLTNDKISVRLAQLDGWAVKNGCLIKEFEFKSFPSAMQFMDSLAAVAEKLNHHPDWSNSYNKVRINLTTHSAGGLTDKDFGLAASADKVYKNRA